MLGGVSILFGHESGGTFLAVYTASVAQPLQAKSEYIVKDFERITPFPFAIFIQLNH